MTKSTLDWERAGSESSVETATTAIGRYVVWTSGEDAFAMPPDGGLVELFPGDLDDAKAAASRHLEEVLLSALSGSASMSKEIEDLREKIESLEQMRPHWAMGYSSDSIAAQTTSVALSQLWELLGAKDQSTATRRLRALVDEAAPEDSPRRPV